MARFDGSRWWVFDSDSTPGLGGDRITGLYESNSGDLWIATASSGLSRYRGGEFRSFTPADGLPSLGLGPKGACGFSGGDAAEAIRDATEELKQVSAEIEAMAVAERAAAAQQYTSTYGETQMRISAAMAKLVQHPEWMKTVSEELEKIYSVAPSS